MTPRFRLWISSFSPASTKKKTRKTPRKWHGSIQHILTSNLDRFRSRLRLRKRIHQPHFSNRFRDYWSLVSIPIGRWRLIPMPSCKRKLMCQGSGGKVAVRYLTLVNCTARRRNIRASHSEILTSGNYNDYCYFTFRRQCNAWSLKPEFRFRIHYAVI